MHMETGVFLCHELGDMHFVLPAPGKFIVHPYRSPLSEELEVKQQGGRQQMTLWPGTCAKVQPESSLWYTASCLRIGP